ncbi:MAG TPA: hypothetical protein VM513_24775 [Kofleriaceae bacterium]|nr:hypothetical protein [Kofleriaceae bacterium]
MILLFCMARTNRNNFEQLLARAAKVAANQDVDSETFITAAWQAYLASHPGMREELEDKALRSELRRLRKRGLVALA